MLKELIEKLYAGTFVRKLLAYHIAREVVNDLSENRDITEDDLDSIISVRDSLNKRMIGVSTILVLTLLSISVVLFGATDADAVVSINKIKNLTQNEAAFVGFVIGNLLFVVTFGTFWKQLVMEYMILNICEMRKLPLGRKYIAFKYTPARYIFYTFGFYGRKLQISKRYKLLIIFVAMYTTVGIFSLYCIFYFYVLAVFIVKLIQENYYGYALILIVLNLLTASLPLITFVVRKQIYPEPVSKTNS